MKTSTAMTFLSSVTLCVPIAYADSFGSDPNTTFDIEFVAISSPGNPADTTGSPAPPHPTGSVAYNYRIAKYEISEAMIDKANADANLGITKDARGPSKPATSVSWVEAAQFVNWLNTSTGSTAAYKFDGGSFQLWTAGDPGYNPNNLYRNSRATYFLPSVDEWYKAAYYDPNSGVYYDYPTGSDTAPTAVASGTSADTAVYNLSVVTGPAEITLAGGLSPYGTAGQGGNVFEWEETDFDLVNDSTSSNRATRGGNWSSHSGDLTSSLRGGGGLPTIGIFTIGFRVASLAQASADFDEDGDVDGIDFLSWQRGSGADVGLGNIATFADGNANADQFIDAADLAFWEDQYGTTSFFAAVSTVPEPTTSAFALAALCLATIRRLDC